VKIYLSWDFDYIEDYEHLEKIFDAIGDTPATYFLVGSRHPEQPVAFRGRFQIGNHSFSHAEWYGMPVEQRVADLMKNHEFLKKMYGLDCKVYRSPHLRNFDDTILEMMNYGYKPEMHCAECPWCLPMTHSHLKVYFSSHHHFGPHPCHRKFEEAFQLICEKGQDFTFFLDPKPMAERLDRLKNIISIGKNFGTFELL